MPKYYLVSAEVFESNFPEEFKEMLELKQVKAFEKECPISECEVVSEKILNELEETEMKLNALECAGVDNWEGYDIAMDMFEDMKK